MEAGQQTVTGQEVVKPSADDPWHSMLVPRYRTLLTPEACGGLMVTNGPPVQTYSANALGLAAPLPAPVYRAGTGG